MLTPTPPKTPPPRRLLEPQLKEAERGAAFRARCAKFHRDMTLGQEDMDLLLKLNREVADLIMSEPPMADTWATRERCRARIRDRTMEDFLVQIKDLEDDRALDEETSDGLRHLPRDVIEDLLRRQHADVDIEREIQRLVKLHKEERQRAHVNTVMQAVEANITSARKAQQATVVIPDVIPEEDKTTAKEKTIEQISSGSEDSKASKKQASKKPASSTDAPKVRMLATKTGEVRFEDPHAAGKALSLDGQQYKGYNVKVQVDLTSQDGTKILVMGLPPECGWQDVKDLMREFGAVAFVQVYNAFGAPKATKENRQEPKWAAYRNPAVAGLIARHHHSEKFKLETRNYVEQLQLPCQVAEILQMLTSSVASGIMQVCGSSGSAGVQEIMAKVKEVNFEVYQLGTNMLSQDSNSRAYQMWWQQFQQYQGYPWPGMHPWPWPGMHPKHRKKSTGRHKDKKSKKEAQKEREKTKEKREKRNKGPKRRRNSRSSSSSSSSSHSSTHPGSKHRRRAAHRALRECERKPRAEDFTEDALRRRFDALMQDRRPRPSSISSDQPSQGNDPIDPAPLDAPASLSPLVEDAAVDDPYLMIDEVTQVPSEAAVGAIPVEFGDDWAQRLKMVLCRPESKGAIVTGKSGCQYPQVEGHPGELHDVPPMEAFPLLVYLKAANAEVPSKTMVSAADASAEMRQWLMGLDAGKGAVLEVFA